MRVQKWMVILTLTILAALTASIAVGAQKSPGTATITSPPENSTVNSTVAVSGKAQLSSGYTLWIMPYDGISGKYYPQGAPVAIHDASWSSSVSLGNAIPVGQKFLIQAVIADKNANAALNSNASSGQKAGITKLPAGAQAVESITVTRGTSGSATTTASATAAPRVIPIVTQNVSAAANASTNVVAQASASASASQSLLPGFEAIYAIGALAIAFVLVLKGRMLK